MKIVLDFPDMPNREAVPFPMEFEGSAGYLVLLVNRIDDKLVVTYHVARSPYTGERQEAHEEQEDAMMKKLERLVAQLASEFNA